MTSRKCLFTLTRTAAKCAVLCLCGMISGCFEAGFPSTPIDHILTNPSQYEGRQVRISGTVADVLKLPIVNITIFVVQDTTGQIPVVTSNVLPGVQQRVEVKGVVESVAIFGVNSIGIHVTERERATVARAR
jgi:hypothetical protein